MGINKSILLAERIEVRILFIRGHKVMLDEDLAVLYEASTKRLNEQVRRNRDRFPQDFMFELTPEEDANLRSRFAISSPDRHGAAEGADLRSQFATSSRGALAQGAENLKSQIVISSWGGRRHRPNAFTEQGVAMLSGVLRSRRAVLVNIEIMRAFVHLRQILASHADLARKLDALEGKYDAQFKVVFDAIRQLMAPPTASPRRPIGFGRER